MALRRTIRLVLVCWFMFLRDWDGWKKLKPEKKVAQEAGVVSRVDKVDTHKGIRSIEEAEAANAGQGKGNQPRGAA